MQDRDSDNPLHRDALELIIALHDDPSPENQARLASWQSKSPAHAAALEQARSDWTILGRINEPKVTSFDRVRLRIQSRTASLLDRPSQLARPAATVLLLAVGVFASLNYQALKSGHSGTLTESQVDVSVNAAQTKFYTTRRGERRAVNLQDGSELLLDWETQVEVTMTPERRDIALLRGTALFNVAPDAERPFGVKANGILAEAIGTEFVVEHVQPGVVDVSVREGIVGVGSVDRTEATRLKASQEVSIANGEVSEIRSRPLAEIGAWREGVIVFEQRPLVEALESLERYTSYDLDLTLVIAGGRRVSGTFVIEDADDALLALMRSYSLTGELQGRNRLVLRSDLPRRPF